MATTKRAIRASVYAPALTRDDGRPVAIVHGMERALPGIRLEWTVSADRQMVHLPQRDSWLTQDERDGGIPFVCNNDLQYPVMLSAMEIAAILGPGNQALLDVHAKLPLDERGIAAAADVLEEVAEGARAFWGEAKPEGLALTLAEQFHHPGDPPPIPPKGLPVLKLRRQLPSPEVPEYLGWVNYWSAATSRLIGFPDPARDADLLSRARRTATGGWVVRLTDEPLDLDNPAHLATLLRAYERFPVIGGRSAPENEGPDPRP
jgi:uncharacterized protein DUF5953